MNDSEETAASIFRAERMSSETLANFHHTTGVTLQKAFVFIVDAIIPLYRMIKKKIDSIS
jgi:uncharacterized protein (UPF0248 family)